MLELLFCLLMQLSSLQNGVLTNTEDATKASADKKETSATGNKTTITTHGIGSGGWDPNNIR